MTGEYKGHGYDDGASIIGDIMTPNKLEGFIVSLEKLTLFVSDAVREYLTHRKRSTQYEQQVLGWFLSLSDVDFEIVSSMTLGDGRALESYKGVLEDLRLLNITVSNFGKLGGCEIIPIGDSPLVSGVSLRFQDGRIVHITPDQFGIFSQFCKTFNEYEDTHFEEKFIQTLCELHHIDKEHIQDLPQDIQSLLTSISYRIKGPEYLLPEVSVSKSQELGFSVLVFGASPVNISCESLQWVLNFTKNNGYKSKVSDWLAKLNGL